MPTAGAGEFVRKPKGVGDRRSVLSESGWFCIVSGRSAVLGRGQARLPVSPAEHTLLEGRDWTPAKWGN